MRRLLAAAGCALVLPWSGAAGAAVADAAPRVQVLETSAAVGDTLTVVVAGFDADRVQVELCGVAGTRSSVGCQVTDGVLVVLTDGGGRATLVATAPAGGCPCRVRAVGVDTAELATVPVAVRGVDSGHTVEAPGSPAGAGTSVVVSAGLVPVGVTDRLRSWFGLPVTRSLTVEVRNTGAQPLAGSRLVLGSSRAGADGTRTHRRLARVDPGRPATVTVPVALPALATGRYVLTGEVGGAPVTGGEFGTSVTVLPVGLWLAGGFTTVLILVLLRRAHRRRLDARAGGPLQPRGLPVVVAAAVTALGLGAGLVLRDAWVVHTDRVTTTTAQRDLQALAAAASSGPEVRGAGPAAPPRPGDLVTVLRLPSLGADQVWAVVEGVAPAQLARGPGHYPGTALPGEIGNAVVAGHAGTEGAPFDELPQLAVGDGIELERGGKVLRYRVDGVRRVPATATDELAPVRGRPGAEPTERQLTLITCAYSQGAVDGRWVVAATLRGAGRGDA